MADELRLPALIFPPMPAKVQTQDGRVTIYDAVRRIRVALTPEEWVRQHCIHWLTEHRHYPIGRCSVERTITGTGQRYDVMVVDAALRPFLLVECKSYDVKVTPETMRQSAWYNLTLQAPYILLTNGRVAYCAAVNAEGETTLLDDIPVYPTVS